MAIYHAIYDSGLEGVLMQEKSKQNTTIVSGYYLITPLPDSSYNFSFLEVNLNTDYHWILTDFLGINSMVIT